jgi:signal transduction histidine kinase
MWPALPFDPYTTIFTVGLLYTLMPLAVWTVLWGRHDRTNTALWCVGALLSGVSYLLFGLRPSLPAVVSLQVANALGYVAFAMRWAALRRERARPVPVAVLAALVAAATLLFVYFAMLGTLPRLLFNLGLQIFASLMLAHEAQRLAEERASRSARMLSLTAVLLAAALLIRIVMLAAGAAEPPAARVLSADIAFVIVGGMLTALWGNVGYLGLAMEAWQRRESARRAELAAATARTEQAERQTEELKRLSDERQELLRVISHEARQPLHNAQAVLQGVEAALRGTAERDAAAARMERARGMLRQITGSLDNTLAASTLLVSERAPRLLDTELEMLVELSLGDLPTDGRNRVRVVNDAHVRSAAVDVGLMRLALRNLLNNALAYAVPGSVVTLRLADSGDPPAVVFEVADLGPGLPPGLESRVFERGVRGRHDVPGQGLGLYIVQQAVRRQGGRVDVRSSPQGTVFSLYLPQGPEM